MCRGIPGPERGMREAADARVRLGAAEPHTERAVPTTCQNVHESWLPGRNALGNTNRKWQHFEPL